GLVGVVVGLAAVPRRAVDAELDAARAAGVGQLADDVALAAAPVAAGDAVPRRRGGPEAEAVVVFRGQDDALEAALFGGLHALPAVEVRRIEQLLVLVTESGAAAGE